jgi:hypothetical protein
MKKIVKLTESDLNRIVKKVLKEQEVADYMFFSNLQQIKRQCEILLEMDPQQIDEIINEGGHDWADDHVTEAKNNMDQVFDFLMNETKKEYIDYENVNEQDYSSDSDRPTSDRERQVKSLFGDKYGQYIPSDVIRYIRKSPAQFIKKIYQMYGDKVYEYLDKAKRQNTDEVMSEGKKKPGTKLCARGVASAKSKYDVYPSAYANGHAIQVCKGKIKGLDGKKHCSGSYC